MLTARASGDPVPGWAGNTCAEDVVAAGVRVFLYEKGHLHAKTISVDSEICSIGSANIDIRSFSINCEINAVLYSGTHAAELEKGVRAGPRPLHGVRRGRVPEPQRRRPVQGFGGEAVLAAAVKRRPAAAGWGNPRVGASAEPWRGG